MGQGVDDGNSRAVKTRMRNVCDEYSKAPFRATIKLARFLLRFLYYQSLRWQVTEPLLDAARGCLLGGTRVLDVGQPGPGSLIAAAVLRGAPARGKIDLSSKMIELARQRGYPKHRMFRESRRIEPESNLFPRLHLTLARGLQLRARGWVSREDRGAQDLCGVSAYVEARRIGFHS